MERLIAALALSCLACTSPPPPHAVDALIGSPGVVTLTNLHPDEPRSRLHAANFQQGGLIPVCSEVALLERTQERLVFSVNATGKRYEYYHHKAAGEPFADHLMRYFGTACPRDQLAALDPRDREGVKQGAALPGMTKQGVVFALGYPPPHVTPSLEADRWIYWTNRFNRKVVVFEGGRVLVIED
jgi:hypothetical protein